MLNSVLPERLWDSKEEKQIMSKAILRFYEELNDLLPEHKQKTDLEADFKGRRSVKDMIEALGVPHTEVDLILANGESVDFSYIVQDADRISVYPVFESLNIENVTRLRPKPLRKTRFVADINLRDIAKYMRALGFDVFFDPSLSPLEIIALSREKNRIILTRSKNLLKHKEVSHGILMRHGPTVKQIAFIIRHLDIKDRINPFSRCLLCNSPLENISKTEIEDRIPPRTKEFCDEYAHCRKCDKIYWKGTHYIKMKHMIDEILAHCH
ncbi:MAG: Mut7-C RNAse domain-containing protein [Desulfatiglans sp.]|jgi:uncharacterized protein with PIN domain|nr:Mut7-C RNAse domain-containing protein [Thermodesulfobacteriota bacterium]MEE4352663.1 Mut7-C RNAse domain-containing protein [Desulfatiglans sp.]